MHVTINIHVLWKWKLSLLLARLCLSEKIISVTHRAEG